ncbi:MAG: 30S ribosomal protein S6 [Rickettsiaceae bacterium]|nr:30S ribosomal protein S6 [Rickettsiaceae bacterium]
MTFYETIIIIRQDVSSTDIDKLNDDFSNILTGLGSEIIKTEYWGLRNLAYDISNNKKGHYVLLGTKSPDAAIKELERKLKLSEDVIRFMTLKVDAIKQDPSPILQNKHDNFDDIIDVTITQI